MAKHKKEQVSSSNSSSSDSEDNNSEKSQNNQVSDEDSESSKSKEPTSKNIFKAVQYTNLLEKFEAEEPDLKQLQIADAFGRKVQVYTLQVPKSINPETLIDSSIRFDGKTKLRIDGSKYVIRMNDENEEILVQTQNLKLIRPLGQLILQKSIKAKGQSSVLYNEREPTSLPDNLKVRHPLFGPEYEDKVVLDEGTVQKLNDTSVETKKKKKKKKDKDKREDCQIEEEVVFQLLQNHSLSKKKKKKRNEQDEEFVVPLEVMEIKKKKKKENQSDIVSEASLNLTCEPQAKQRLKKNKSLDLSELDLSTILDTSSSKKVKKSKKQLDKIEEESSKASLNLVYEPETKHKSMDLSNLDLSTSSKKSKKKKNRNEIEEEQQTPTKKHKKNKKSDDLEKLNDLQAVEETTMIKHKKSNSSISELSQDEDALISSIINAEFNKHLNKTGEMPKKSKKKQKFDDVSLEETCITDLRNKKKKNTHKTANSSIVNSTVIPDIKLPDFELDISRIISKSDDFSNLNGTGGVTKKSKKKVPKQSLSEENGEIPVKKSKKDKNADRKVEKKPDSLISDLLNSVKLEFEKSSSKRKRTEL